VRNIQLARIAAGADPGRGILAILCSGIELSSPVMKARLRCATWGASICSSAEDPVDAEPEQSQTFEMDC
jgi:hypothetical protein